MTPGTWQLATLTSIVRSIVGFGTGTGTCSPLGRYFFELTEWSSPLRPSVHVTGKGIEIEEIRSDWSFTTISCTIKIVHVKRNNVNKHNTNPIEDQERRKRRFKHSCRTIVLPTSCVMLVLLSNRNLESPFQIRILLPPWKPFHIVGPPHGIQ